MSFRLGFDKDDNPVWFNLDQVLYITPAPDEGFYRLDNIEWHDGFSVLYLRLPKPNEVHEKHPKFVKMTRVWGNDLVERR